jgi:hypothetical protein
MLREGLRLSRRHQSLVYWSAATLFATGALWLWYHYLVRYEGEFGVVAHPLEQWWLKAHGAAAMVFLMALGSLARGHIRVGWKMGQSRGSGGTLLGASLVLIGSGWALYYVGGETLRPLISIVHWTIGLVSPAFIVIHVTLGRRERRARHRDDSPPVLAAKVRRA